jgi:hydroxyethylthiazole kinase-like uncharacterized protein yjeF
MRKIITSAEMREIDRLTTERYATPSLLLMEAAAESAARAIVEKLGGDIKGKSVLILCGKGSNGGDGAALARKLWLQGAHVYAVLFGNIGATKGDAFVNFEINSRLCEAQDDALDAASSLSFYELEDNERWQQFAQYNLPDNLDAIVDALFGTGLTRPIEGRLSEIVHELLTIRQFRALSNPASPLIVSLDIPSGLNADSSEPIGVHAQADLTVTFTAPKPANVLPPASRANGELIIAAIGSPQILIDESPSKLFLIEEQDAQRWLIKTRYMPGSYKNTHGHALVVAGSRELTGAAVMASDAAMRAGAGLVTVATAQSALPSIAARVMPEVMTAALAETEDGAIAFEAVARFDELAKRANVVAMGCGMTAKDESTRSFVRKVVERRTLPMVLDADALNALAPFPENLGGKTDAPLVLTPHIGEFRRLIGAKDAGAAKRLESYTERTNAAREFATKNNLILVLKGERTIIAAPDGSVFVNPTGNAGLGTGGSGDTLTGFITGFLAQTFASLAQRAQDSGDEKSAAQKSGDQKSNVVKSNNRKFDAGKSRAEESSAEEAQHDFMRDALEAVITALYVGGVASDFAARAKGMRAMTASDLREHFSDAICALDPQGEMPPQKKTK